MHAHLIISGHVQGVGFRFTAQQKAKEHHLTGWVRNNFDGTVEMEIEGEQTEMDLFIGELKKGFNRFIQVDNVEITKSADTKGYKRFSIN